MNFCSKCGNHLESNLKFCTQCGAPVSNPAEATRIGSTQGPPEQAPQAETIAPPQPPHQTGWQPMPVTPVQPQPSVKNSSWLRTAFIALSVLAVVAALGIGGLIYVGYK